MQKWLVGVDEAGRGPLAGPLALAVFILPRRLAARFLGGIRDSKKATALMREAWYRKFASDPRVFFEIVFVRPRSIDRWGVTDAVQRGMHRLFRRAAANHPAAGDGTTEEVLLDGGLKAPPRYRQRTIIKGDEREPVIAAASIVAKVRRDRTMVRLARKFPEYGFEIHKGYGTKLHRERICEYGLSDIHRRLFCRNIARLLPRDKA